MAADQPIPQEISDAASQWLTARDAGIMGAADEREFARWIAADPLHARAYAEVGAFWDSLGDVRVRTALQERYAAVQPPAGRVRGWIGPALAASIALAVMGTVNDWPTRLRADAMTMTGERRDITLADGSVAQLDTASAIGIDYSDNRRTIRLIKGEAAFTVAPDRARPFTVEAGGGSTTALGTRFIVRRDGDQTDVTVTHHSVRVALASGPDSSRVVAEGQTTRYGPNGIMAPRGADAVAASAWTRGTLVFVDRPLGEVVAELNRYHPGYMRVLGDDLWQRRVSGGFRTDDPLGAVETLQRTLGIGSTRITDRLIFIHS